MFAYCYSLYGSVLWDLNSSHIESLCITWRKGLRRAWSLPANTHCTLLSVLSNSLSVKDELAKRTVRFIQRCHLVTVILYVLSLIMVCILVVCCLQLGEMCFYVVLSLEFLSMT